MNAGKRIGRGGNTMRRIAQATVLALLVVSQPQAQTNDGTIARLRDVNGNVLVSNDSGLATGGDALRLVPGTRVITTANSKVVIEYDDGCRVTLKENERFATILIRNRHFPRRGVEYRIQEMPENIPPKSYAKS